MPKGVYLRKRQEKVEISCLFCRQTFLVYESENWRKYCSKKCGGKDKTRKMIGKKFGCFEILSLEGYEKHQLPRWHCKCTCGKEVSVKDNQLRRRIKSCDRLNLTCFKDLKGVRFGKLVVIKQVESKEGAVWSCRCDCGRIVKVSAGSLNGGTRSCRCIVGGFTPAMHKKAAHTLQLRILEGKVTPQENRWKAKERIKTLKGGSICCQSTWEVTLANYLDSNSSVVKFEKDKVRIPYIYNNKERVYIVDFLVTYQDQKQELIEVKPKGLVTKDENPAKFEVAKKWCDKQDIEFIVITEDEISLIKK
jgi:hypothetical protein